MHECRANVRRLMLVGVAVAATQAADTKLYFALAVLPTRGSHEAGETDFGKLLKLQVIGFSSSEPTITR